MWEGACEKLNIHDFKAIVSGTRFSSAENRWMTLQTDNLNISKVKWAKLGFCGAGF